MKPNDADLHVDIGEGYIFQMKFREAAQSMVQAQEIKPDHGSAAIWLAYIKTKVSFIIGARNIVK